MATSNGLTWKQKWSYGVGDFSFSLTDTIKNVYLALFLTDVVGVSPAVAAIVFFVGSTWDYVNDPLAGYITDHTHTRWGRRRPFILFGTIPFALTFMLLWFKPPFETAAAIGVYFSIIVALYDTAATFVYMPYFALTPDLTGDYDERTSLTSVRMFFSIAGSLVAFTLPLMMVGSFNPANADKVLQMGIVFGAFITIPLFIAFFGTKERELAQIPHVPLNYVKGFLAMWKNKAFVFGLFMFLFNGVTMSVVQVILLYYVKYVVRREGQSDLIMATIFVVAILMLPLWDWVSKKLNKRRAYIYGISFLAVVFLVISSFNPETSLALILFLCFLAGIGVSAMHVLPWAILPDAIEVGELQTGERNEGMFYSFISLAQKVASSIAVPLVLLVLQYSGYVPNSLTQPDSAVMGIRFVAGPVAAIMMLLSILFTALYPLDREHFKQVTDELEERRKNADGGGL